MIGIIISVIFLIVGAYMSIDGYNSMSAIWRDSNESLLMIGIVVLVLGVVILLVSLVKMVKGKNQIISTEVVRYCENCHEALSLNEEFCHKCGTKQNK